MNGSASPADIASPVGVDPGNVPATSPGPLLELTVVVPTFNEAANIEALLGALQIALDGHAYEIVVVDDDSPDGTADRVRALANSDLRIRCIQRIGRRGLSGAVIEGVLASTAPIAAVIDGDMQHDETLLPAMLKALRSNELDIVVASRYLEPGGVDNWERERVRASAWATLIARRVTGVALSDPMSGFFAVRADLFRSLAGDLSRTGFKVLLDLFLTAPKPLRFRELPYRMRSRSLGASKLDARVVLEFVELLIDKAVGRFVPAKFVIFALVGALGVVVHLIVFVLLFKMSSVDFQTAQGVATLIAMTSNFTLNNIFTYYDRRLYGWAWLRGWLSFGLTSSVGLVANIGIATYLFAVQATPWPLSVAAGVLIGVVWNYAVTSIFTWGSNAGPIRKR